MHYPVENMTIEQLDHMAKTSLMEIFKQQAIDELKKRGVNVIHVSYEGNNDNQKFYDEIKKENEVSILANDLYNKIAKL